MYVKTYSTRGVNIFDTTGCGDVWAGTIVLLEHHIDLLAPVALKISRFMRIASGAAWAKLTSPLGAVRKHDLIALLDNDYIPWTHIGLATEQNNEISDKIVSEDGF